ncbi:hypothetical protein ACSV9I_15615 [Rhizobium sp. G187]|uniref:hypothetical protein n=1 Tax=Rhizobium sp. G187 TaxID=3451352 RepID=UPI003EE63EB6
MDQRLPDMSESLPDRCIEILPPEPHHGKRDDVITCPCCQKSCAPSSMDDDGCGICDECLAP